MKTIIHDTADIVVTRKSDGHVVLNTHAQLASISQSISEEFLKGGIGNKNLFLIRSDKEVNLSMRSATFDMEYLSMTQGVAIDEAGTATITKIENLLVADNAGILEATLVGTPANGTAVVIGSDGKQESSAVTGKVVTVATGVALEGETVQVLYQEVVTGNTITMDSTKFSEKYKVEYRTIEYSLETSKIVNDIYFVFDEVIPSGAFELSLENGSAYTPEIDFMVLNPANSNVIGRIIQVPHVEVTTP